MAIYSISDHISRRLWGGGRLLAAPFREPVLRLGVSGLSRAGKTVFMTGLIANLQDRARMPQLRAQAQGRIQAVYVQSQPDDTLPRFDFEGNMAALCGPVPNWPHSTTGLSQIRLSLRMTGESLWSKLTGRQVLHVDITDYPGEWLLDLALMDKDYREWSDEVLTRLAKRPMAAPYLAMARAEDGALDFAEPRAQALAQAFTAYLVAAKQAGWADCSPGRFLVPGDLAGSPALTFAPLPFADNAGKNSLWHEMARRFAAYQNRVVRPFFKDHFAQIDRQIVLLDVLEALHHGPPALENMRQTMADILRVFQPGPNSFLNELLYGKRVEKILFAATKADYLHHEQHPQLNAITESLLRDARDLAAFAGAGVQTMSLAALRTTVEEELVQEGRTIGLVRGRLLENGQMRAMYAGELPQDPARLLAPARQGAQRWLDADYTRMIFAPVCQGRKAGEGLPHIRLDRAAEFLIGDCL